MEVNQALHAQIDKELQAGQRRFNFWMLAITLVIVLATATGLVFQGWGTQVVSENPRYLQTCPESSSTTVKISDFFIQSGECKKMPANTQKTIKEIDPN